MLTITAVIRAKPGHEEVVERALRAVIAEVKANEPDTVAYFVSRSRDDPTIFTTFERFESEAAMARHNDSRAVADFVAATRECLDGPVVPRGRRHAAVADFLRARQGPGCRPLAAARGRGRRCGRRGG